MKVLMQLFEEYIPASTRGMFSHCFYWLTSKSGDYIYDNPDYVKSETDPDIAIYCVHGTADRPASFTRIAERLLQKGLPGNVSSITLVAFEGRGQGKSVEYFAEQLIEKIKANQHQRVILIGHSRGGLVSAYAAEYLAAPNNIQVKHVFGIGTPFKGSVLALAPLSSASASVDEMRVDSTFLISLTQKVMLSSTKYYFIVAKDDYIVWDGLAYIPAYVEKYPDSLIELKTRHGHLSIMSSHQLVTMIQENISRKDLSPAEFEEYKPSPASSSSSDPVKDVMLPVLEIDFEEDCECGLYI